MVEEVIVVGVLAVAVMLVYYTLLASPGSPALFHFHLIPCAPSEDETIVFSSMMMMMICIYIVFLPWRWRVKRDV